MSIQQLQDEMPGVQDAIYSVALSLDAFLLNGIPYGVLRRYVDDGFLRKVAGNLQRDLSMLADKTTHAPLAGEAKLMEVLATLRAKCQDMIDLVTGLSSFRALPLQQLRASVSQILPLRDECVQLIQELEAGLRTPKPFYPSRPSHSAAMLNEFLAELERLFSEEWTAANAQAGDRGGCRFPDTAPLPTPASSS